MVRRMLVMPLVCSWIVRAVVGDSFAAPLRGFLATLHLGFDHPLRCAVEGHCATTDSEVASTLLENLLDLEFEIDVGVGIGIG